jgi:hypothetical protein
MQITSSAWFFCVEESGVLSIGVCLLCHQIFLKTYIQTLLLMHFRSIACVPQISRRIVTIGVLEL